LFVIEFLPVRVDSTAILESIARVPLATLKILVILESFNLIAKEIILTRVLPILHLVKPDLYIILFKVDGVGFLAVDGEISVHCASLGIVYIFITIYIYQFLFIS